MPMSRRRYGGRSVSGPTRKTTWLGFNTYVNGLGTTGLAMGILLNTRADEFLIGGTVIRIRGEFGARVDASSGLTNGAVVTAGIMIITADAAAAGGAAVPSPFDDADAPWMWHTDMLLQGDSSTSYDQLATRQIDNKAMRKLASNQTLVAVIANEANVNVSMGLALRVLFKLP